MALKDDIKAVLTQSMTNFAVEAFKRFPKLEVFNTLSNKVTILIGTDANKSVRTIANEELALQLIPANAKESLNTLQEISAWIQSHPDEAAAINAKLTLGTYNDNGADVQYATVKAYVEAYVAAQLNAAELGGSDAIDITNNVVSLLIDTLNANGLTIGANGLKLAVANGSTTGALASTDWTTFNDKQEQVVVPSSVGVTSYVAATGTYDSSKTYYTSAAGTTVVDTSGFEVGVTDVSSYFIAQTVNGNVITKVELDADGKTIKTEKGLVALTAADFEALTASECATIFNNALVAAEASIP